MKKVKKTVTLANVTKSRVDTDFIRNSSLPLDRAIHVAALLANVSERAVRRQLKKS
jgi:hypothetical protein